MAASAVASSRLAWGGSTWVNIEPGADAPDGRESGRPLPRAGLPPGAAWARGAAGPPEAVAALVWLPSRQYSSSLPTWEVTQPSRARPPAL